jgi:hypothetical protein
MTRRGSGTARRVLLAGCLALGAAAVDARTENGNDFALALVEEPVGLQRQRRIQDGTGLLYYFRYLRIRTLEDGVRDGHPYAAVRSVEPASGLEVVFTVRKTASLRKLNAEPRSEPGAAIAVTGRLKSVDLEAGTILLDPVIVRHKDRLEPKVGKELMAELDPNGTYYSYTGPGGPLRLTYKDRDLLKRKAEIMEAEGGAAWAEYLRHELAKRAEGHDSAAP